MIVKGTLDPEKGIWNVFVFVELNVVCMIVDRYIRSLTHDADMHQWIGASWGAVDGQWKVIVNWTFSNKRRPSIIILHKIFSKCISKYIVQCVGQFVQDTMF